MPVERNQSMAGDAIALQELQAAEVGKIDDERRAHDLPFRAVQKLHGRFRRAACRDQIINDQDALAGGDRVFMNFDDIDAVFQRVFLADRLPGELALLADGNEAAAEPISDSPAEN